MTRIASGMRAFMFLFTLLVFSNRPYAKDVVVKHGVFFGHCAGFCIREIELSNTHALYMATNINRPKVANRKLNGAISKKEWDDLIHSVDQTTFNGLNDRIGCPDCSDGGGEWVEIQFNDGSKKRVTFDYGKSPTQIADLVKKLQLIQKQFDEKIGN